MFEILFQFQGGMFQNTFQQLQSWGFFDVVIPFALIFAILYTVINAVPFLKDVAEAKDGKVKVKESRKNIRVTIALAISLMTVVPHVIGVYPGGVDVVQVINQFLPETTLVVLTLFVLLMLFGLTGSPKYGEEDTNAFRTFAPWVALGVIALLLYRAISPQAFPFLDQFRLFNDPSFQALIIAVMVFGLVIWLVVGGQPKPPAAGTP